MRKSLKIIFNSSEIKSDSWLLRFSNYFKHALENREQINVSIIEWEELNQWQNLVSADELTLVVYCPSQNELEQTTWQEDYLEFINEVKRLNESAFNLYQIAIWQNESIKEETSHFFSSYQIPSYPFYFVDSQTGDWVRDMHVFQKDYVRFFLFKVFDLAKEVNLLLRNLKPKAKSKKNARSIFFAEVSYDIQYIRNNIIRELKNHGYHILPQPGIDVFNATDQDLLKSRMSIHFFGNYYIEHPSINGSIEQYQNQKASEYYLELAQTYKADTKKYFKRIIWMPEELKDLDQEQKDLLDKIKYDPEYNAGADIIRCPVEELKDIIIAELERDHVLLEDQDDDEQKNILYLIYNENQSVEADQVKRSLEEIGFQVYTTVDNDSQFEITQKSMENLMLCDGVVFLSNAYNLNWVRSKINLIYKAKGWGRLKPYSFKAIISNTIEELPLDPVYNDVMLIRANHEEFEQQLKPFIKNQDKIEI